MAKKKTTKEKVRLEITVPERSANTFILQHIIGSKGTLIMHALGTDDISITVKDGKITFPWFDCEQGSDEAQAYMLFVTALCRMSKSIKKVNTWDKEVPNEKYAFRCFLLRLGFIGDEYKAARKILLRNLEGNTAFRTKEDK